MDDDEALPVVDWLRVWFSERAPDVELQPQDNYFEKGALDSFDVILLIEEVETRFSIRFVEDDFQDRRFATVDGLASMILEKKSVAPT